MGVILSIILTGDQGAQPALRYRLQSGPGLLESVHEIVPWPAPPTDSVTNQADTASKDWLIISIGSPVQHFKHINLLVIISDLYKGFGNAFLVGFVCLCLSFCHVYCSFTFVFDMYFCYREAALFTACVDVSYT